MLGPQDLAAHGTVKRHLRPGPKPPSRSGRDRSSRAAEQSQIAPPGREPPRVSSAAQLEPGQHRRVPACRRRVPHLLVQGIASVLVSLLQQLQRRQGKHASEAGIDQLRPVGVAEVGLQDAEPRLRKQHGRTKRCGSTFHLGKRGARV